MTANLKSFVETSTAVLLAACLLTQNAQAGPVGPLTTFTSGTTAKASEVNGNFSAVSAAVNENASRITTLETNPNVSGNITLVEPSTATAGNIMKGTSRFIHDFGTRNTFVGVAAGNFTTLGADNTAVGWNALTSNAGDGTENPGPGNNNTAIGSSALRLNTTGSANTATGSTALQANTTGRFNTAVGQEALFSNTTGTVNTASGVDALFSNTTGSNNVAIGSGAGFQITTGSGNVAIGAYAGNQMTTGSNNITIGTGGVAGDDHILRIGDGTTGPVAAYIVGILNGSPISSGTAVVVDGGHRLGIQSSSRSVKDHIADMGEASSAMMKLRPVTFYYKSDRNPKGRILQYGLVAEEVADVMPGLVGGSADGKIKTVYYQFLAPMLLNEMQKQQREIKAQLALAAKQSARIAELERERREQTARIEALEKRSERMAGLLDRLQLAGVRTAAAR